MEFLGVLLSLSLYGLIGFLAFHLIRRHVRRERERRRRDELERQERERVRRCSEVVLFLANNLGYIARESISRDELGELIDNGIRPEDLFDEVMRRIEDQDGLVLGYQNFRVEGKGEFKVDVKLTQKYRDRHVYVIGKSGSGKTNLLRCMIYQDIMNGNGIGVIAPEAEMIEEEILPYIPDWRVDDVIYLNPADESSPVCFNPLHLDEGEDIDRKVEEAFTIFMRVFDTVSPRMEVILRQSLYALIEREGTTLLDIERLLSREDSSFRNRILKDLKNQETAYFFTEVYPSFPKDAHLPVITRLHRLIKPRNVRNIICNPRSSLDFRRAMDDGKIMLFNLSDGILGEGQSQLLGQLIVSKFQMATLSRADMPKEERRRFYLYIDEFQTFTGVAKTSYEKILSRARKYGVGLILAHQQTSQIPYDLLREILGNVSTMISFNISAMDASRMSKEFVTEISGEVLHIPEEEFLKLRVGEAFCRVGRNSFLMRTYLAENFPRYDLSERVREVSRERYGIPMVKRQEGAVEKPEKLEPTRVFGYEQSNSNALFIRNRITHTSICGVVINGTATPKFRGNYIAYNMNGISIGPAAQPDFGTKDDFGENTILGSVSGWRDENPVHMVGNYWGSRYGPLPRKISKGIRDFLIVQPYLKNPPGSAKQMLLFRGYSDR